ncbi:LolA family protein [Sulfitobacter donghicola]|uniref:Cell envelope biogenesis protein LolA n=1 Tax=Sulfitobacter donghicola DSW-25 = KCTC 12864 = JCM 14565 TaxID=1300350 RepID=A0A073ILP1_9RHOB|nr:outer membrane lipoprotein carrier protein LolA [Sulfitobacter donghicola]KEJ90416.1 cell envelope biogenesis protein LolA [Sulfitobacter donghicola DSW-25 = KCTC 12864 = JCM 14565]KIN67646.1 Outer membrane lipoprotein carrier protein LolA [Sulfitobacter donghicola DSW-25 = KCTC 12864 = JCM 14565]
MRFLKTIALGAVFAAAATTAMADKLPLSNISSYLNAMTTAQGEFTQINADGTISTGTIYIKRPGRVRFEYNAPDTGLVIAGSNTVVIYDTKSNQPPESYPLSRTPLSIILARNVNLNQAKMVTGHAYDGTATTVTAQDPENPQYGNIQMKFTGPSPELRQWIINDGNGSQTTVVLGELKKGGSLPNKLFDVGSPGSANR